MRNNQRKLDGAWLTLAAAVIGSALSSGVVSIVLFGLTLKPIAAEFAWSRSQVSLGLGLFYVFNGLGALMLGHFITKYRVRWPALAFTIGFATANALVAFLPASVWLFTLAFGFLGLLGGGCTSMPYAIGITGWFDKWRGLALAIAVSGTGLGHIVLPTFAVHQMRLGGWRGAYLGVAVLVLVLGLLALVVLFREPPDFKPPGRVEFTKVFSIYKTNRNVRLLAAAIFLLSFASLGLSVTLTSLVTDLGFASRDAAMILTAYGASNWVAKIATGLLLDKIHVRFVAATIFSLVGTGGILLLASPGLAGLYIAAILIGCGVGAEADIMAYAAGRYARRVDLGNALGSIWVLMPWGAGLGVFAGSAVHDLSGSYAFALAAFAASALAAAMLVLRLGPYWPRDDIAALEPADDRLLTM